MTSSKPYPSESPENRHDLVLASAFALIACAIRRIEESRIILDRHLLPSHA
jgi:hypothetical protein